MTLTTPTVSEEKATVVNHINHEPKPTPINDGVQDLKTDPRAICESVLGPVNWMERDQGYILCPGHQLHSTSNGPRDCRVYLHPVPSLNCFHSTCKELVREKAKALRRALNSGHTELKPVKLTTEQKRDMERKAYLRDLGIRARHGKGTLLKENAWTLEQLMNSSPVNLAAFKVEDHWKLLLEHCFRLDDMIWIGERYHSGEVHGVGHFKSREEWLAGSHCPGPLICPSTFKPGVFSRSTENVVSKPSLVVESDVLSKDEMCAVFNWINHKVGIELKAVVDTGNKSLHGWFDYPPPDIFEELRAVLPELGCDEKTLHPSQPVRLPGCPRGDKHQRLVYLKNRVVSEEVAL